MQKVVDAFAARARTILGDDLCGVYLHGSAAMGCFSPVKSDIDLIVVAARPLTHRVKRAFLAMTAALNEEAPPKGIEMSVVTRDVCRPFIYPTPYELHFSAGHLDRYLGDPDRYIREMQGADRDLAAHFTVIREKGRCVWGQPIPEVFDPVPQADYLDALWYDVAEAEAEIEACPMYFILNLARVLAFAREGTVLSKAEGGRWALAHVPAAFHPLIRDALREYTQAASVSYDGPCAKRYATYMLAQIRSAAGLP